MKHWPGCHKVFVAPVRSRETGQAISYYFYQLLCNSGTAVLPYLLPTTIYPILNMPHPCCSNLKHQQEEYTTQRYSFLELERTSYPHALHKPSSLIIKLYNGSKVQEESHRSIRKTYQPTKGTGLWERRQGELSKPSVYEQ